MFLTQLLFLPRSPVIRAMLEAGMMEGLKGRVKVEDTEPAILRQLLQYLYTRQLGPDFRDYQELMVLANKYQVEELVDFTSTKILETLTVDNALQLGIFGETNNSSVLINGCGKFIREFASEDLLPEGWEEDLKGSPRLMLAIIAALREAGALREVGKETEFHRFTSSDLKLHTGNVGTEYALDFEVSTEAKLSGIGLYGVPGSNKVKVGIFHAKLLLFEEIKEYQSLGGGEYTKLALKSRVNLQPNIVYTIVVERLDIPYAELVCGTGGKSSVRSGNVEVTFSNSSKSCSGTDVQQGQIPSLYLRGV